jgi:hypothetical protein
MSLKAEEISNNWNSLLKVIETEFTGDRKEKLLKLYNEYEERISTAPASSVDHYHNAFIGGYVDHVLRVIKCARNVYELWTQMGADTREELMFVALNHDLGKIGFPGEGNEVYVYNDSEWHRKNQGKIFKVNPKNPFALVNDLSIWLLQHYDIKISFNEMIGIKCTDGLYDESNKPYFISRMKESKLRTNLPYVMHQADLMAARIEYEMWREEVPSAPIPKKKPTNKLSTDKVDATKLFGELFGD